MWSWQRSPNKLRNRIMTMSMSRNESCLRRKTLRWAGMPTDCPIPISTRWWPWRRATSPCCWPAGERGLRSRPRERRRCGLTLSVSTSLRYYSGGRFVRRRYSRISLETAMMTNEDWWWFNMRIPWSMNELGVVDCDVISFDVCCRIP